MEIEKLYETVKITFTESIQRIDKIFEDTDTNWGVATLKERVDSYESSRFTQIDEFSAIVTSEYNMKCLKEWLMKYFSQTITIDVLD
jgi:hypothetical protein